MTAGCCRHHARAHLAMSTPGCKDVGQVESNAAAADLDMVREDHPQAWRG